jgi:hypothetical protein
MAGVVWCSLAPGPAPVRCSHLSQRTIRPSPLGGGPGVPLAGAAGYDSYLVDSASSHMLVSKIKPCMSKYKQSIR